MYSHLNIKEDRELEAEEKAFTPEEARRIRMDVRSLQWFMRVHNEDPFHFKMRIMYTWWYCDHLYSDLSSAWDQELGRRAHDRELEAEASRYMSRSPYRPTRSPTYSPLSPRHYMPNRPSTSRARPEPRTSSRPS